jgi:methionine-S-sulfoxide reductase
MISVQIPLLPVTAALLGLCLAACTNGPTASDAGRTAPPSAETGRATAPQEAPTTQDNAMISRDTAASTRATSTPAMTETAILAGGCFWGMEDILREQPGVLDTEVGYTGGSVKNATYENHEGHAEAIRVVFDPTKTSYAVLLDLFFRMHDPTTKNRQGNDVGTSYRSAIFYLDDAQKREAEAAIARANASGRWKRPVVTEVTQFSEWWPAEEYHQDYLEKHPGGYTCHYVRD